MTRKQQRIWFLSGGLAVLALTAVLVLTALSDSLVYFYSPTDLSQKQVTPGQSLRLGGLVEEGSVTKGEGLNITFVVTDLNKSVPVHFEGLLPDLFREGQGVVVEGALTPAGKFEASTVLAKHDENYMPKEVADALKEQGEWRPDETLVEEPR